MEISRTIELNWVKIDVGEIRALVDSALTALRSILSTQAPEKGEVKLWASLEVRSFEDQTWSSEDADEILSLVTSSGPFATDQIADVRISLRVNRSLESIGRVVIRIVDGRLRMYGSNESNVTISANDQTQAAALTEIVTNWEKCLRRQSHHPWARHPMPTTVVTLFLMLYLPYFLYTWVAVAVLKSDLAVTIYWYVTWAVMLVGLAFMFFGLKVSEVLKTAYPCVELITGPSHAHAPERSRRLLVYLVSAVIVPFTISVIASIAVGVALKS